MIDQQLMTGQSHRLYFDRHSTKRGWIGTLSLPPQ